MLVVAGVLGGAAAVIAVSRMWSYRHGSLGDVSQQWLGEYRASRPSE
jgi:hypothetical protein